jgi:hypothetical protein
MTAPARLSNAVSPRLRLSPIYDRALEWGYRLYADATPGVTSDWSAVSPVLPPYGGRVNRSLSRSRGGQSPEGSTLDPRPGRPNERPPGVDPLTPSTRLRGAERVDARASGRPGGPDAVLVGDGNPCPFASIAVRRSPLRTRRLDRSHVGRRSWSVERRDDRDGRRPRAGRVRGRRPKRRDPCPARDPVHGSGSFRPHEDHPEAMGPRPRMRPTWLP